MIQDFLLAEPGPEPGNKGKNLSATFNQSLKF